MDRSVSPGGTPIPRTVVEKINPADTSYGDNPYSRAFQHRKTDSVPDLVLKAPGPGEPRKSFDENRPANINTSPHTNIPETIVTPVDAKAPKDPFGPSGQ